MRQLLLCLLLLLSPTMGVALDPTSCPEKITATYEVEGVYLGIQCEDYCYAEIKLDSGTRLSVMCNEDEVDQLFGNSSGHRVHVIYADQQIWDYYGEYCAKKQIVQAWEIVNFKALRPIPDTAPIKIKSTPLYYGGMFLSTIDIIACTDSVTIKNITVNRGNTKIGSLDRLPVDLKFGEKFSFGDTKNILEITIDTDLGEWTFTF